MSTQNELTRGLSTGAVVAGVFSVFALMILFMFLAGGFELWKFDLREIDRLGLGFWMWSFVAWAISNYFGAYTAGVAAPAKGSGNGMLHGFVVWAIASVVGMMFVGIITGSIFNGLLLPVTSDFILWGALVCDIIALGSAFRGGIGGSNKELTEPEPEPEPELRHNDRRTEPAFGH